MATKPKTIKLPEDFQAFAEELVREGKSSSVEDVVRDALHDKKIKELRAALDVGIAQLDAGLGRESSIEEFMAEIDAATGLTP